MSKLFVALVIGVSVIPIGASAAIYQVVDPETGHVTYTNLPPRSGGAQSQSKPDVKPATPARSSVSKSSTPANFPHITTQEQRSRDTDRKQILLDELRSEENLLKDAQVKQAADEVVHRHEANIKALQREVNALK